jgi:antitoxin component YwqK of YwqJK toxin-antitoxin module
VVFIYDNFEKEFEMVFNIDELKDKNELRNKELPIIQHKEDGRMRFCGEFLSYIFYSDTSSLKTKLYDNKDESNNYGTIVYFEGDLDDGLPNVQGKLIWDDGRLLYEGEFKNGQVTGFGKAYFVNGGISEEGYRLNGELDGECICYHENGSIRYKGNMKNGISHGYGVSYYEDGKLEYKGECDDGWAEDGIIRYTEDGVGFKRNEKGSFIVDDCGNIIETITAEKYDELLDKYNKWFSEIYFAR